MSYVHDVEEFYRVVVGVVSGGVPRDLTPEERAYRLRFLEEELEEYRDALAREHRADQLDALVDLVYVAIGTARVFNGFDFETAWQRVHAANLAKVGGGPGKRGHEADTGKPVDWLPPALADLVGEED